MNSFFNNQTRLAAQMRTQRNERWKRSQKRSHRLNERGSRCPLCNRRRRVNSRGECSSPCPRIIGCNAPANKRTFKVPPMRDQSLCQQPCRLHRHADPFGHHGMRLARRIADDKYTVAITRPNARLNRAGRQPCSIERGAIEHWPQHGTRFEDVCQHRFAGRLTRLSRQPLELPPLDTARQTCSAFTHMHHSAIAAVKAQQRHQPVWQPCLQKVCLECQPIIRSRRHDLALGRQSTDVPRTMRRDEYWRGNFNRRSRFAFNRRHAYFIAPTKIIAPGRLKYCCAQFARPLEEQRIELLPRQCPPPLHSINWPWQRCEKLFCTGENGRLANRRPSHHAKGLTDSQPRKKRPIRRRQILAANLATRKRLSFDQRHGQAGFGKQDCCRGARRTTANNQRIKSIHALLRDDSRHLIAICHFGLAQMRLAIICNKCSTESSR